MEIAVRTELIRVTLPLKDMCLCFHVANFPSHFLIIGSQNTTPWIIPNGDAQILKWQRQNFAIKVFSRLLPPLVRLPNYPKAALCEVYLQAGYKVKASHIDLIVFTFCIVASPKKMVSSAYCRILMAVPHMNSSLIEVCSKVSH